MVNFDKDEKSSTAECADKFLPKRRTQILSAFIVTIGSFGLGTVLGWSAPVLPLLASTGDLGTLNTDEKSLVASFALFGALLSPVAAAALMSRIGRKLSMFVFAIPFIIGWILVGFATTLYMIYVGRFITGLCGAAFTTIIPVYIGEIADKRVRGALSTMMILMLVTGVLFAFVLGSLVTWQTLSLSLTGIPCFLLLLLPLLPETPRYYISQDRQEDALKSLVYLRGANKNSRGIQRELEQIQENFRQDQEDSSSWKDLFVASSLKPILISLALIFFQQMCGANAVSFRQVEVVESAGTGLDPNLASIIIAASQVVLVLVPTFTVDRLGRKALMLGSQAIMILGLIGLAIFFHLKESNDNLAPEGLGWLPLTSLLIFTVGYNIGMGPIPFVVSAELLPSQTRGLSTAVVIEFYYILSTLTTLFFGNITESLGWTLSYSMFALICLFGSIFILFVIPETKGKSAEQIELLFKRKSTVRRVSIRSMRSQQIDVDNNCEDIEKNDNDSSRRVSISGLDNPAFQV